MFLGMKNAPVKLQLRITLTYNANNLITNVKGEPHKMLVYHCLMEAM